MIQCKRNIVLDRLRLELSYRIGIISDTHGLLRNEVKEQLESCDMILHAGDIDRYSVIEELNQIAPTYAVRGNADKEWAEELPVTRSVEAVGIRIFMIHNKKHIESELEDYDLIIYGHSHKYEEKDAGEKKWLNPGSCGPRRFSLPITMAVLYIEEDGSFRIRRIDIAHPTVSRASDDGMAEHVREYIPAIIQEIEKERSVEQIAKKFHISQELSEQICRLYLTHPGINAEGIVAKMDQGGAAWAKH